MGGDRPVRIGDSIALLVIGAIRRFGITGRPTNGLTEDPEGSGLA
jgi:hypothetical protein